MSTAHSDPSGQSVMSGGLRHRLLPQDRSRLQRVAMLGGIFVVVVVAAGLWFSGGRYINTDDAYVRAAKLMVTTDVSGLVKTVNVKAGQHVKKGAVLFTLQPEEFQNAVNEAKADLDQTALDLKSLKAEYKSALSNVTAQQATVQLDQINFDRYSKLVKSHAVSQETLDNARETLRSARATLAAYQHTANTTLAKLNGNPDLPLAKYPSYQQAKATLAEDQRQLRHTVIHAPFDCVVTSVDALQPGMLIVSSLSSFSTTSAIGVVSADNVWVSANLKETKLTNVRKGQKVDITIDRYPGKTWHGTVEAVARGTENAFSVMPQENSSANWVKVTQRIPVRISLDRTGTKLPMSYGMSAIVTIDTGHRRWWRMIFGD